MPAAATTRFALDQDGFGQRGARAIAIALTPINARVCAGCTSMGIESNLSACNDRAGYIEGVTHSQWLCWPERSCMRVKIILPIVAATALALAQPGLAETLGFGADLPRAGWTIVSFPGIPPASFKASDASTLEISTDASAGLLWRAFKQHVPKHYSAQWSWRADEGVAATDLTKRGADDRVLGVYFVFGEAADATKGPLSLLASSSVTALVYVFGGDKPRGSVLPSPHMGSRGRFMVLRPAGAPKGIWFDENVDLPEDYVRAFGRMPPLLLAVAISSDSDDTRARNRAKMRNLTIGK